MKSILLHTSNDDAMESRLQVALDIARRCDAHLMLAQTQPYEDYLAVDMFGGAHLMADVMAASEAIREENRAKLEERMSREDVKWDWQLHAGGTIDAMTGAARFADLIVFSLGDAEAINRNVARDVIGQVALEAARPVLAVPTNKTSLGFDRAMVAYDGGAEAANAIRNALPLLKCCETVELVEVEEKDSDFPMTDACAYLARHGIASTLTELPKGKHGVAETLMDHAQKSEADFMVMGAYGRGRLRETLFGGVTKDLLFESPVPLIISR